jgi:hypothetical protein
MSVMGELARYLDALIDELEHAADPDSERLAKSLRAARPTEPGEVSPCAERIVQALDEAGLGHSVGSERSEFAPALHDAAHTLTKLCRIVLGR